MSDPITGEDRCPTCGRKKPGRRSGTKNPEKRFSLKHIVGVATVPAEAAQVAIEAIALAKRRGDITDANAWQLLFELLPADYLAATGELGVELA